MQLIAEMKLFLTAKYFYESSLKRYLELHLHDFRNLPTLTQLLTEMSTRKLRGREGWPEFNADNLTAICEPII
jgi:hypothetical protein